MKNQVIKFISSLALLLIGLPLIANAQEATPKSAPNPFPVMPAIVEYEYAPAYFMQWIENHSQYSIVEAIVDDLDKANSIQIILTSKETNQRIFYCTSQAKVESSKAHGKEAYLTKIDFKQTQAADQQPTYGFGFRDRAGQAILWRVIPATRPSERGAGLTPLGSAANLRIEYRELGTAVGEGTMIQIGDQVIEAEPWKEISAPPYFAAHRGSVSLGRHIGAFSFGGEKWQIAARPEKLQTGAEWILNDQRGRQRTFKIVASHHDELIINEINQTGNDSTPLLSFVVHNTPQGFALRSVRLQNLGQNMRLAFNPALPLSALLSSNTEVAFTIAQGKHDKIVSGTISVERENDRLRLRWQPKSPDWAKPRAFETSIKLEPNGYELEAVVVQTRKN